MALLAGVGWMVQACATGAEVGDFQDPSSTGQGGSPTTSSSAGGDGGAQVSTSTGMDLPCGIDCSTIQTDDCHEAVCNTDTKQCEVKNSDFATACDDGVFCTVDDACSDGVCIGGPQNDCGINAGDCDDVVCDENAKSCSTTPKGNGATCTNADLCQVNSTCQNGLCTGIPKDCFFAPVPNECHTAFCNSMNGMCEPQPDPMKDNDLCVDALDFCTVAKTCLAGVCQGGQPKDCSGLTIGCNIGVCDMNNGMCVPQAVLEGQMCDDLDACTLGETCTMGNCGGGTPVTNCSGQVADLCCPNNCNEANDIDCAGWNPAVFPVALVPSSYGLGDIDFDQNGDLLAVTGTPRNLWKVTRLTGLATIVASNVCTGTQLLGVAYRASDNLAYVVTNTGQLCSVTAGGTVANVIATGTGANAIAIAPASFAPYGGQIIVIHQGGVLSAVNPVGPTVTTIATGANGSDLAFGPTGVLYISGGSQARTVTAAGVVSSFATGLGAADGITVDPDNSRLFIADSSGDTIKQVTIPGAVVTTLFSADIDSGYYVQGIIHDNTSTLIYATGEQTYTLLGATP